MPQRALPVPSVPVIGPDGKMTQPWYEFFANQRLAGLNDVSTTAPTNGQVLVWNSTTRLWTPGAN